MTINPWLLFGFQLGVFIAVGISQGTVHLTHMIPDSWIPAVIAWNGFIAFVGTGITTTLTAMGLSTQSRIAAAASLPEVKQIIADKPVAEAAPSDKVQAPK